MQQAYGFAAQGAPMQGPAHLRCRRANGLRLLQPSQHRACPFRRSKDALQGPSYLPSAVRAPQQAPGPTPAPDAWGAVGTLQQAPFADPLAACRAHAESLVRPSWTATTQWHLTTASQLELSTVDWRERLEKLAEESWTLSGVPSTNLPSGRLTAMAYGTAAMRGSHKPEMQDAHVTVQSWQTLQGHDEDDGGVSFVASRVPCSLAGVFDGHCGSRSARYSASRVSTLLARNAQLWEHLEGVAHPDGLSTMAVGGAVGALRTTFAQLEREILDEDRHKPPGEFDGTTALVGLQAGEHLFVANLGDSRAVLCRNGGAVRLSRDHTPDLPDERKRVEAVGGHVRQHRGVWRLVLPLGPGCGLKICAVSRALGDIDYKEPRALISAVPDVSHWPLNAHSDEFVIYASDGVWAVCTDQEAVECVQEAIREAEKANCTRHQCAAVASLALQVFSQQRGSKDDITTVVGLLNWEDVPQA